MWQAPPDAILGISDAYKKDTDPRRMNLGVGAPLCRPLNVCMGHIPLDFLSAAH